MSGGSLDYAYAKISIAAEDIAEYLRGIEENQQISRFTPHEYYRERYSDRPEFKCSALLKKEVVRRLRDAVETLRKAEIYARRAEWLMSSDDGFESFIIRTDEELKKLEAGNE